MSNIVLDASVLVALAKGEHYGPGLLMAGNGANMSAVNLAEVLTRLIDLEVDPDSRPVRAAFSLLGSIEPFTETQARLAAELRRLGKNVTLGDRACMALAIDTGADLYTADREWAGYSIGIRVHLIR